MLKALCRCGTFTVVPGGKPQGPHFLEETTEAPKWFPKLSSSRDRLEAQVCGSGAHVAHVAVSSPDHCGARPSLAGSQAFKS